MRNIRKSSGMQYDQQKGEYRYKELTEDPAIPHIGDGYVHTMLYIKAGQAFKSGLFFGLGLMLAGILPPLALVTMLVLFLLGITGAT